ncbi:MAG: zinc dependent phospholipase C family protein [Nitrospirae bacterium]|nr:zinc dependent phospholipase C family protein [Nitrospirota bacterium]
MIAADKAKRVVENKGLMFATVVLNRYPQWLQAGAVGPDYPYLHHMLTSHDDSDSWADLLHYNNTGEVVRSGAKHLRDRYKTEKDSKEFQRTAAWLFGYASHVVLDASIHPVVRAIVGEYAENKTDHRVCEMYMDSYIFKETYGIELDNSEWVDYLRHLTDKKTGKMDNAVVSLWRKMLQEVYPKEYAKNPPQVEGWHEEYVKKLDGADIDVGFFRHIAGKEGLVYVPSTKIPAKERETYIVNAEIPEKNKFNEKTQAYSKIFDFGVGNIVTIWEQLNTAIVGTGDTLIASLPNWNLDTGTTDKEGKGDATLWV